MYSPINSYLDSPDTSELEVRFRIDNIEVFQTVFNSLIANADSATLSTSLIAIVPATGPASGPKRKEIYFLPNGKKREAYVEKQRGRYWFAPQRAYKLVQSREVETSPFGVSTAQILRFRFRCSIVLMALADWRFDFTVVKEIGATDIKQLKTYKAQMLPELSAKTTGKDFLKLANLSLPGITGEIEAEYIGSSTDAGEIAAGVKSAVQVIQAALGEDITENSEYHDLIYELAGVLLKRSDDRRLINQFRGRNGLKELSNNPVTLGRADYMTRVLPNIDKYYFTEKTDGSRCWLVLNSSRYKIAVLTGSEVYVTEDCDTELEDRDVSRSVKNEILTDLGKSKHPGLTILDCEFLGETADGKIKSGAVFYVFDVLVVNDRDVSSQNFSERWKLVNTAVAGLAPKAVMPKNMIRLDKSNYKTEIPKVLNAKRPYRIDGGIFQPAGFDPAIQSRSQRFNFRNHYFDMRVYKYKPADENTIDFLICQVPESLLGKSPYDRPKSGKTLYVLLCGINYYDKKVLNLDFLPGYDEIVSGIPSRDKYFPIQFSPSCFPNAYLWTSDKSDLHQKIGEFQFSFKSSILDGSFKLTRVREDKTIGVRKGTHFGNNFKIAESIMFQLQNPLLESDLVLEPDSDDSSSSKEYFVETKADDYKPLAKVNNFVEAQLIRQIEKSPIVVDLASGKGQKLFVYNCFGIKTCAFVDVDAQALEELNRRRYLLSNSGACVYGKQPETNMHSFVLHHDLTEPSHKLISALDTGFEIKAGSADAVIINLAIHYLISDKRSLNNLINLVSTLLRPNGVFIFTCFSGQRVFDLLESVAPGSTWDSKSTVGDLSKYSIRRDYPKAAKFTTGLGIAVRHHFSGGAYYAESLVDVDSVVAAFCDAGFKMQQNGSFGDMHEKFAASNRVVAGKLSADDRMYSSLYQYVSLYRI